MNIQMKKILIVPVAFLVLALTAGTLAADERFEEKFARTESLARDGNVSVTNVSGTIRVRTWDKAEVQVDAVKISRASSSAKAKENADLVRIEVVKEGDMVRVETKYPDRKERRGNLNVSVNYVLSIPDRAALRVNNVSGNIDVENIGGPLSIDEVSGDVKIEGAAGTVDCKTVSGGVTLSGGTGDVNLKAVSGRIVASGVKGSIEAETVSGGIVLRDVRDARSVRAKTISGGIECETDIVSGGRYSFDALSGGVELVLPASASFNLEAETFNGTIKTDFAVTVSGRVSPRELRGVVGSGGAVLRVKSFSGTIEIRKK
ncbi:MAG: DUF4097 family beta strand repeat protein [Candidatus Aminicenantes bacterium]|nr:DUF4097 family beta strand repeat protein [Candidatus Aminicenantes bacterium]